MCSNTMFYSLNMHSVSTTVSDQQIQTRYPVDKDTANDVRSNSDICINKRLPLMSTTLKRVSTDGAPLSDPIDRNSTV